jgi:hypothetical protein
MGRAWPLGPAPGMPGHTALTLRQPRGKAQGLDPAHVSTLLAIYVCI